MCVLVLLTTLSLLFISLPRSESLPRIHPSFFLATDSTGRSLTVTHSTSTKEKASKMQWRKTTMTSVSQIDGRCTGIGRDTTSRTVHCRRTESRVLRDPEDRTTLTTASELEVRFIPTLEAARPSLDAGDN
ncbi:hypothetical protein Bca52824_072254 [Brassica carinata]|uniref:Secreted protein n=1 Tax=Brassica carinata TaxID=52824 RepID=A0A8X7Q7T9_BRACI|nr:hypothetical protein Bca52824_072254 [Brassica carinata]